MDHDNNDSSNSTYLQKSISIISSSRRKKSFFAFLSLLFLFLLSYNVISIFCIDVPFSTPAGFSPASVAGRWLSSSSELSSTAKRVMYAVKEEEPSPSLPNPQLLPLPKKPQSLQLSAVADSSIPLPKRARKRNSVLEILRQRAEPAPFSTRVKRFLNSNSSSSCKVRFFMTWISSANSFRDRELFAIESLFRSHPNGCLIIVSNSMDSVKGNRILSPFLERGFRVTSISPNFDYLFKNTMAESWFNRLKRGEINTGAVPLGQNLSNLMRLALLYKFGGVYVDTDVIILKSFARLRNAIGAQTVDLETQNWSRLNNAVMIFDKGHPLVYKFIEEFARTFDGNKWGHNGPYLVSRVVSRVLSGREGLGLKFNFTVLPPLAFYPVDWSRIGGFFRGPKNEAHSKWLRGKLRQLRSQSFAVHLWNRQSKRLKVEEGSIIGDIRSDCCVFCDHPSSSSSL